MLGGVKAPAVYYSRPDSNDRLAFVEFLSPTSCEVRPSLVTNYDDRRGLANSLALVEGAGSSRFRRSSVSSRGRSS